MTTTPRQRGKGRRPAKAAISIRISQRALDALRASGPGWQTRLAQTIERVARRPPPPEPPARATL